MRHPLLILICFTFVSFVSVADIIPGNTYKITSISGKKSLSVRNSSLDDKAEVITWTETNVNTQKWRMEKAEVDFFFLTNEYTDKELHYSTMRPKAGDKLDQDRSDNSSYFQWEFVPVNNVAYPNTYFIRFSMKSSDNYLYLEQLDDTDGSVVKVQLKSSTADSIRQMWKIEQADPLPRYMTQALRDSVMNGWKNYYYKPAAVGHILGNGGWWGDAEMFETVLDAFETTGDPKHKEMFRQLYMNFTYRNGTDWSYNEFNDDIAWMVLVGVRAYLMFDDSRYLNHARSNYDKMYARALLPSGMLRWKETPLNNSGTNSCINGPAEVAACYLAIATGDDGYYDKAKQLYTLQRQYLYEPATGKVFDSGVWNGSTFTIGNHWVSTYNQGTFLGAALMLYDRYGDEMYKNDAHKIVEWTRKDLCNAHGVIRVCGSGNDLQGFKGILMRYLRRYIVDLAQPESVEWLQRNAMHAYNNRNSKRISWTAWWEKSTENFIFSDGYNYSNQPFGASTAVSAAFNAPLDKNRIIKDAYSVIEADHFDYLKGVFVEENTGSTNGSVLGNIYNNCHTVYCNVDFGTEQAKSATFNVLGGTSAGSIEIRLGSPVGKLLGIAVVPAGNAGEWSNILCEIEGTQYGLQRVYLVYKGEGFKLDNFRFLISGTGLKKSTLSSKMELYPNPATDNLFINSLHDGHLTVFSPVGKQVFTSNIAEGITNLDINGYDNGVYFISINTINGQSCASFLKK